MDFNLTVSNVLKKLQHIMKKQANPQKRKELANILNAITLLKLENQIKGFVVVAAIVKHIKSEKDYKMLDLDKTF